MNVEKLMKTLEKLLSAQHECKVTIELIRKEREES